MIRFRATHRTTSYNLGGLYPFSAPSGASARGILMGTDLDSGSAFSFDMWELYPEVLTGLIGMVIGKLGMRKSTYLKTYIYRSLAFDRYARVLDPKGEYRRLAEAVGTEPIKLEPGGKVRLNPLDHRLLRAGGMTDRQLFLQQLTMLRAICEASIGPQATLTLGERGAVRMAFLKAREEAGTHREATIPDVVEELKQPNERQAQQLGMTLTELREAARQPMLALQELVDGELAGMFDGPTTSGIQLDHPLLVLDVSEVYKSAAQGVVMVCAGAWIQQLLLLHRGTKQMWVVDEGWALMRDLSTARWLLEATKFSRVYSLSLWIVLHQFSDLSLAGGKDSEQAAIGRTLLSHAQTKVIYGQDASEIDATRDLMRLSRRECEVIGRLRPSQSLQRIGENIRVRIEHVLTDEELELCETDEAMAG